ncbi:MAG: S8 family serine peptidase [Deltaproteobacteria bacterium]|uniref:S8 family serine peptidase n=1 Tax=Candidatus Desulfacyla euxinica TaxID=2841693 RepID=A0A8J6T299_9DELT|nr:S8 family serine peptidase [Candidatus Desulfacyla euxinica]
MKKSILFLLLLIPLFGLIFGFCLFLFPSPSFAEEIPEIEAPLADSIQTEAIRSLSKSPKLTDSQAILEDFINGGSTTRVIVNIRKPAYASQLRNFRNMAVRRQIQEAVRESQDSLIDTLDLQEIRITNRFVYIFGFSCEVTLEGLQNLIDNPEVLSIEKDRILHAQLAQGIPLMNASTSRSSYNGSGLAVAICDTGIDYTHSMLGGGGFPNSKVIGGYDCGDDDTDPMDQEGHGTACAGITSGTLGTVGDYIGGVAYNSKLYAVKISTGSTGSASASNMIEGWEWCITHQNDDSSNPIMIISTSFGGGRYYSTCDSASTAMTTAAANAVAAGMTLFVSSGNDGYCDSIGWPACISHVISVGAVYDANLGRNPPSGYVGCIKSGSCVGTPAPPCDEKWYVDDPANADQVTTYSNTASFLSLLAPSNWAYTTELGGGYWDTANGFGGTSAACPYAAGAAACLQSAAKSVTGSYLSPGEVKSKLVDTGDSITDEKVSITKPRVDLEAAVNSLNGGSTLYVDTSGSCGGNTPCYTTVQGAIDAAGTGATIKILQGSYSEDVTLSTSKQVTLSGGWNASYTTQSSTTTVNSLTISNGSITVDNLVLETASAQMPPTVTTGSAPSVTSSSATLNGTVNPNGASTTYYFQYGTSTSYGSSTTSTSAGSGTSDVSVDATISGLSSSTTYHFRLVATNSLDSHGVQTS